MFNTIFDAWDTKLMVLEYTQSRAPPQNPSNRVHIRSWVDMKTFPDPLHTSHHLVERVRWQGLNDEWRLYHWVEYVSMVYPASDTTIHGLEWVDSRCAYKQQSLRARDKEGNVWQIVMRCKTDGRNVLRICKDKNTKQKEEEIHLERDTAEDVNTFQWIWRSTQW